MVEYMWNAIKPLSLNRMITHALELLTAGSTQAEILLHEEQSKLGGICIEELHRLIYAQILSSHALTWNVSSLEIIIVGIDGYAS